MADLTGWVHGNTITLDEPVEPYDGMRVVVRIEKADDTEEVSIPSVMQARLWQDWLASGPQGPIDDEGEPEFP
jgi:hypothetical protein